MGFNWAFKGLNAEVNPICHLLALLGADPIPHISRIRVKNVVILHDTSVNVIKRTTVEASADFRLCLFPQNLRINEWEFP
jgi:hypothetical protein